MNIELSAQATKALINAATDRQGARVVSLNQRVVEELFNADLIGPEGGLTRRGTIVRERLVTAALDAAFN